MTVGDPTTRTRPRCKSSASAEPTRRADASTLPIPEKLTAMDMALLARVVPRDVVPAESEQKVEELQRIEADTGIHEEKVETEL